MVSDTVMIFERKSIKADNEAIKRVDVDKWNSTDDVNNMTALRLSAHWDQFINTELSLIQGQINT